MRLINNYEMIFIDKSLQPVYTVVMDCPGKESIRRWPLPVVDPWLEDWWERRICKNLELLIKKRRMARKEVLNIGGSS